MKLLSLLLGAALGLSGCATSTAQRTWPSTVVTIEQVKVAEPLRLSVGYRFVKGVPLGTTLLHLYVSEQGRVKDVKVVKSSGHANLDEGIINSAWDATFHPYIKDGQPIEVTLVMQVHLR